MPQLIALTVFNIILIAFITFRLYAVVGDWRKVLAALPTPMLGFASSYGVYAFNRLYVPPWVAVVMAAAYETTYIGLAALDNLDDEQRKRAKRIAKWAAMISFAQNAIAGVFHAVPQLQTMINAWQPTDRVWLYSSGSLLHAAQVWIAYVTADLTLHRPSAQASTSTPKTVKRFAFDLDDDYSHPLAAKQVQYPEPELIGGGLPIEKNGDDPRRAEIIRLRDEEGLKFSDIALHVGLSQPSVTNIYHHGVAVPIAQRK
jgi:hypothetical protein